MYKHGQKDSGPPGQRSLRTTVLYGLSIVVVIGVVVGLVVFLSSDANPFVDDDRGSVPEDAGKKTAIRTEEYRSLVQTYGKEAECCAPDGARPVVPHPCAGGRVAGSLSAIR